MSNEWHDKIKGLYDLLAGLSVRNRFGDELGAEDGFVNWCRVASKVRDSHASIFFVGNGASASMASHFAADLSKNAAIKTEVFSDLALITAMANDFGYQQVFAEPLRLRMRENDLLVAISSSGRSENILAAVAVAQEKGGAVISLSAMAPKNPLRTAGDLNFYVGAEDYGLAESAHAVILHHWIDLMEA